MTSYTERRDAAYEATLTAIDDAVERRCSHCHAALPEGAASEWWCSEGCQIVWQRRQAGPTVNVRPARGYHGEHLAGVTPTYTIHDELHRVDTDARERALEHVRNRNIGPRDNQRAPRRIDPRRAR